VGRTLRLASRPDLILDDRKPFGALDPIIRTRAQRGPAPDSASARVDDNLVNHDMEEAFVWATVAVDGWRQAGAIRTCGYHTPSCDDFVA